MSTWLRIKAEPRFCGPLSVGTVEPIRILRGQLNLSLADAKAAIDTAVFEGVSVRILVASDEQARLLAGALASSASGIVTAWVEPQARVDDLVLVIPSKADEERDAVAAAWELAGGTVTRVDRFWDPPPIARDRARPYGPDTFALVLAEKLGLELAEPDPYAVARCPEQLLGRAVSVAHLGDAAWLTYPCFVKPIIPKQFRAAVFRTHEELLVETRGLENSVEVLRSDVIDIRAEARAFVLDGVIQACALYEGVADVVEAAKAAERISKALQLPRASVIDVGLLENGAWVFIEANAAWGAGLNGCDPHDVVSCVAAAARARGPLGDSADAVE